MKKIELIVALTIITLLDLSAQSKVDIYFDIAPVHSYRTYSLNDYSEENPPYPSGEFFYDLFIKEYDSKESATLGFISTLGLGFNINDKVKIITGLGYKNIGEKVNYYPITGQYESDGVIIPTHSTYKRTLRNSYQYIKIPADIQYKIKEVKGITLGLVAGLDLDVKIKDKIIDLSTASQSDQKHEGAKVANIALNVHAGFVAKYHWKDNVSVFIQPEFARSLTPIVRYNIQYEEAYAKINQYYYYGQIRFGIILSNP